MNLPEPVASIAERLALVPQRSDAAIILRHAEREEIPAGTYGAEVPLTVRGVSTAEQLGAVLSDRGLAQRPLSVTSSPVPRCVQTAQAIRRGGGQPGAAVLDWRLGDPGPFVVKAEESGPLFLQVGILEIARRQLSDDLPPPGMRPTSAGIELLLGLTAHSLEQQGRLNIYVTHDAILAVLAAWLYRAPIEEIIWPGYLDGLLLWQSGERLNFSWRGLPQASRPTGG